MVHEVLPKFTPKIEEAFGLAPTPPGNGRKRTTSGSGG